MKPRIDLEEAPQIALTVACPNPQCAAPIGEECRSYLHAVRVLLAVRALPRPRESDV